MRKGDWKRLPDRRRRLLAWYTLANPFIQAATGVLIPIAVVTVIWGGFPVWLAILTFLPVLPTVATLIVEVVALGEVASSLNRKARFRGYLRLVLGSFFYQLGLSVAAIRALLREMAGDKSWEKTDHVGSHRELATAEQRYSLVD